MTNNAAKTTTIYVIQREDGPRWVDVESGDDWPLVLERKLAIDEENRGRPVRHRIVRRQVWKDTGETYDSENRTVHNERPEGITEQIWVVQRRMRKSDDWEDVDWSRDWDEMNALRHRLDVGFTRIQVRRVYKGTKTPYRQPRRKRN